MFTGFVRYMDRNRAEHTVWFDGGTRAAVAAAINVHMFRVDGWELRRSIMPPSGSAVPLGGLRVVLTGSAARAVA